MTVTETKEVREMIEHEEPPVTDDTVGYHLRLCRDGTGRVFNFVDAISGFCSDPEEYDLTSYEDIDFLLDECFTEICLMCERMDPDDGIDFTHSDPIDVVEWWGLDDMEDETGCYHCGKIIKEGEKRIRATVDFAEGEFKGEIVGQIGVFHCKCYEEMCEPVEEEETEEERKKREKAEAKTLYRQRYYAANYIYKHGMCGYAGDVANANLDPIEPDCVKEWRARREGER